MPFRAAVLLLDLQVDFLDTVHGRMPVSSDGALRVVAAANEVLEGRIFTGALPVLVVNKFPVAARVANFFRHGAAVAGSPGAELDPRIRAGSGIRVFPKERADAFTNPALEPYLREEGVERLCILGVFAEGCIRATALSARRKGFKVEVPQSEIATNSSWKEAVALWALRRGGVTIIPNVRAAASEALYLPNEGS